MNQTSTIYTREQMIAFLAAWMKQSPSLTLSAARDEGLQRGFTVGRREYEEARMMATGSPVHPQFAAEVVAEFAKPTPKPDARVWLVDYLRTNPKATFADVKGALTAAGYPAPTPIAFGLARKAAGIASVTKPKKPRAAVVVAAVETPREPTRAGKRTKTSDDDVFAEVRRVMDERARFLEALKAIEAVVRACSVSGEAWQDAISARPANQSRL